MGPLLTSWITTCMRLGAAAAAWAQVLQPLPSLEPPKKAGHIKSTTGSFNAVAIVTDAVRKGVAFAYFGFPGNPANSVVPRVPDPVTNRYRFKLGKGRITKIGESPYKRSLTSMSFAPRTVM